MLDGALTIAQAYRYFPPNTIHLVVVNPGVGSARRPLLAQAGERYFIAPDNGVLSLVLERERVLVRHITASHHFLHPVGGYFPRPRHLCPVRRMAEQGAWSRRNSAMRSPTTCASR